MILNNESERQFFFIYWRKCYISFLWKKMQYPLHHKYIYLSSKASHLEVLDYLPFLHSSMRSQNQVKNQKINLALTSIW